MSTAIMEGLLRDTLNGDRSLSARDCRAAEGRRGGVSVERAGVPRGTWHWRNGAFELDIGDDVAVVSVESVAEALRYTREHLCPP